MKKICINPKTCRKTAGYTQEESAEMLNISIRQLSAYENNKARIPVDIIARMARIYNAPLLIIFHAQEYQMQICELYAGI